MSKTVSSLVLLIGMTIGGSVSAKNCKQFLDEEYFSNRQQLRNEGKLKRLHKQHRAREIEAEYKAEIESAINGIDISSDDSVENNELGVMPDVPILHDNYPDDGGFNLTSVFEEWEQRRIT